MLDCMVDVETLGQVPGCSILSIGAVMFDENGLGEEFHTLVNRQSCRDAGLHEDNDTIKWWASQPGRGIIVDAEVCDIPLPRALFHFETFLGKHAKMSDVRVWGNGADFDNAILAVAWKAAFEKMVLLNRVPWKFWNNRCYRTVKSMAKEVQMVRVGEHHNALDDAKSQALHLINIWKEIGRHG